MGGAIRDGARLRGGAWVLWAEKPGGGRQEAGGAAV